MRSGDTPGEDGVTAGKMPGENGANRARGADYVWSWLGYGLDAAGVESVENRERWRLAGIGRHWPLGGWVGSGRFKSADGLSRSARVRRIGRRWRPRRFPSLFSCWTGRESWLG